MQLNYKTTCNKNNTCNKNHIIHLNYTTWFNYKATQHNVVSESDKPHNVISKPQNVIQNHLM